MKLKFFTTYDSKVEMYLQPFVMRSRGEAIRSWTQICNDPKTQFNQHPSDFTLFEIGEYDEETGALIPYHAKVSLGLALEFKKETDETMTLAKPLQAVNNK